MTEQEIQDAISAEYETTADTPDASDDDYLTRRLIMNRVLNRWARMKGYFWDELWATQSIIYDAAVPNIVVPTGFRQAGGFIDVLDGANRYRRYPVIKPNTSQSLNEATTYAVFTGNPKDGYELTLNPALGDDQDGMTVRFTYYKDATPYSDPTSVSEIPDPEYIIHGTVAELWKSDRKLSAAETSLQAANEAMDAMKINQLANVDWQNNQGVDQTPGFGW